MGATFVIAMLLAKKLITAKEAMLLNKLARDGVTNNNLQEMLSKVEAVLNTSEKKLINDVQVVDAKTLLK